MDGRKEKKRWWASEVRGEGSEVRMFAFVAKITALNRIGPGALPSQTFFFRA